MKPTDLSLLRTPGAPTLSPDGGRVAYAVTRLDLETDAYRSRLWLAPTDGSQPPRPLTHGARDTEPQWSPDGRWIAFLRAVPGDKGRAGKAQLHVMAADGGEPRRLTDRPLGVSAPVWRPDSGALAFLSRCPEPGRYGTDEDVTPDKEPPRRITTLRYRVDGVGFLVDKRQHVFVVELPGDLDAAGDPDGTDVPEPQQVTHGDHDDAAPAWSPDGGQLAFVSDRDTPDATSVASDVYVVAAAGGEPRRLTDTTSMVDRPGWSPDGGTLTYVMSELGESGIDFLGRSVGLADVPAAAGQWARRTPDAEALHVAGHTGPLRPAADGSVLVGREHRGAVELVRVAPDGSTEPVLGGQRTVTGWAEAGGVVAAAVASPQSPGEVVVLRDGQEHALTDLGALLREGPGIRSQEELDATAPDGTPVHGWVVRPPGEGPHPVLLMIHGGPFTQYGWLVFDEAQVYADAGYAVVMGNPRGASGYGEIHGRAIQSGFGTVDADDLLALLDAALEADDLDAGRVGVLGGSYGGFMTTWLMGHHSERFRAAISERALNAWDSFTGSSDIGWFFTRGCTGVDRPDDAVALRPQDPLQHADGISKPVLIIHSEQDWRCPLEQAQRLFVKLRLQGVETELLVFPGEGHELSRSGLPSHRVARFDAILDWWSRHL